MKTDLDCRLLLRLENIAKPVHGLVEAFAFRGWRLEYLKRSVFKRIESQLLVNLGDRQTTLDVLLVCKHKKHRAGKLFLPKHVQQLVLWYSYSVFVSRVHDVDDRVCVRVVASPVRPNWRLSTEIPHLELEVFVCHLFDVEADCGNGLERDETRQGLSCFSMIQMGGWESLGKVESTTYSNNFSNLKSVENCGLAGTV